MEGRKKLLFFKCHFTFYCVPVTVLDDLLRTFDILMKTFKVVEA